MTNKKGNLIELIFELDNIKNENLKLKNIQIEISVNLAKEKKDKVTNRITFKIQRKKWRIEQKTNKKKL